MKKKFSLLLGTIMLLSSVTPVFASEINETHQYVYEVSEGTSLDEIYQDAYNVAKKATRKTITDDYSAYSYLLNHMEDVSISKNQISIANIKVSGNEESLLNDFVKRLNVLLELGAIEVNSDLMISKKDAPKLEGPLERKVHEFEVMRDCRKHAAELTEVFDNAVFGKAHYVAGMYFAERVKYGGIWDYKEYLGLNTEYYEPELDEIMTGETIGNFHYGYVGRAVFSPFILKSAAGLAQVLNGDFNMEFIGSYFDDPRDTANIQWGIDYYELDN